MQLALYGCVFLRLVPTAHIGQNASKIWLSLILFSLSLRQNAGKMKVYYEIFYFPPILLAFCPICVPSTHLYHNMLGGKKNLHSHTQNLVEL